MLKGKAHRRWLPVPMLTWGTHLWQIAGMGLSGIMVNRLRSALSARGLGHRKVVISRCEIDAGTLGAYSRITLFLLQNTDFYCATAFRTSARFPRIEGFIYRIARIVRHRAKGFRAIDFPPLAGLLWLSREARR